MSSHVVQGSNPRDYLRLTDYCWLWPANTLLLGIKPPFTNYDWPNPTPPPPPIIQNNIRVLIQPVTPPAQMPFVQSDWPLPQTYPYVNYNYTLNLNISGPGSTLNPFSYEWNSIPDNYLIDQFWSQNLVLNTLSPPPPRPHSQYDYPNPRSILLPIDQFWSDNNSLLPTPNAQKPFVQSDWPIPGTWPLRDQTYWQDIINLFPPPPPVPPPPTTGGGGQKRHHHLAPFMNEIISFARKGGSANKTTAVSSRSSPTGRKK